jgi:MFS family permease
MKPLEEAPRRATAKTPSVLRRIPAGIWALGMVSMLMDTSSEMIHALLPVYLVGALGASALAVGVIEGIAESTAAITKVFSGALSDWLGRRKLLVAIGYGLAACTKPIFPLASTLDWVVAARFVDRVGKGIRGAPRDALIADLAPAELRGASFGLRQSLDTAGAFLGPALAIALMWLTADNIPLVFWFAVVPGFAAFALVVFGVHDAPGDRESRRARSPLSRAELARLPPLYWGVVVIAAVFTLARFSEAFLVLRAQELGLGLVLIPLVLVLSDLALAFVGGPVGLALGVALWGLHMGMTQGLLAAMVADAAPANLRGTAYGMFNLVSGLALLAASVVAGGLWDTFGSRATFLAGAGFAIMALLALVPVARRARRNRPAPH